MSGALNRRRGLRIVSYLLSAVSFMHHNNWLYYSSKSIVIDPI